jgi:hypothetical protein
MYCVPARPKLYMNLKTTSFACFPNELLWILITLRNDGNQPLRDIIFSSDTNLSSPLMIPGGSCKSTDVQSDYLLSSVLNPGQTLDQDIMCHIPINTAVGWLETIFTLRAVGDVQELPVDQAFPKASPLLSKPLMYCLSGHLKFHVTPGVRGKVLSTSSDGAIITLNNHSTYWIFPQYLHRKAIIDRNRMEK